MLFFFIGLVSVNYILTNDVLVNRLTGQSKYNTESNFKKMGSGRGEFLIVGLEVFSEAGIIEKIIGVGRSSQVNKFKNKIGKSVGSHNAFMDVLLVNGLIGLMVFLVFLFRIVRFIRIRRSSYNILSQALFISYLMMSLFQGYGWLSANVFLMLSLALTYNNSKKAISYNKKT